jgi:hypothetical protein
VDIKTALLFSLADVVVITFDLCILFGEKRGEPISNSSSLIRSERHATGSTGVGGGRSKRIRERRQLLYAPLVCRPPFDDQSNM